MLSHMEPSASVPVAQWNAMHTMTEKTPFFISPAYSVPRMTISMRLKLISTEVVDDMPLVKRLAGNWPAL